MIKDRRIKREDIFTLLNNMGDDISTHSLSMWIKSKTDDEFVVVPRYFCSISFIMLDVDMQHWDIRSESEEGIAQMLEERRLWSKEECLEKRYDLNNKYLKKIENYL